MSSRILIGDCRDLLATLPDESVHCCVTSPPYFRLRDYNVAGQMGIEPTLVDYIDGMVAVFREVRRVLRSDGTLWLNIGDSYAGSWGNQGRKPERGTQRPINGPMLTPVLDGRYPAGSSNTGKITDPGLKPKDLMMVPARLAIALQEDGWWLRSDCIWHKTAPMPESVTDRPTSAHEHVFLLTKAAEYWYDAEAVKEPGVEPDRQRNDRIGGANGHTVRHSAGGMIGAFTTRNLRNVWTLGPDPYAGAHFATFPKALAETCIKAGCPVGGTVLDPFLGSGTTLMVADRLGRDGIGIELNPEYAEQARFRITNDAPLLAVVEVSHAIHS